MTLRMFPTEDRIFKDPDDGYFDALLYSECMPYMPCVILHESSDGDEVWVYRGQFLTIDSCIATKISEDS